MMRKTWWHYSHTRLSVSNIALYALTTVYILTIVCQNHISSFSTFISLVNISQLRILYFLDSPWWDSWLWVWCDLSGWSPCQDCGPWSAGHLAPPWPPACPGHSPPASRKLNARKYSLTGQLNGFHWIIVHPVINVCPYPWHDRFITELSIEIITPIRSEIRNQSFYFPSDRMCQACVRQAGISWQSPCISSMNIHCIFCQLRLSQGRVEVAATLYSLWYESSFQEPNFHVMRL